MPLREEVKFNFLKAYAMLRRTALQISAEVQWDPDLVFHLDPQEVFRMVEEHEVLFGVASERKRLRQLEKAFHVPAVLPADDLGQIDVIANMETSSVLRGIGVTNAVTEGEVVVVRSVDEAEALASLKSGSILVTITTDPAWSPILSRIGAKGGLVTEVGGLLAHGAVYAREVGIAAVLNVPRATEVLRTGMRVCVNGPLGTIEIVE
jgi:rifampicin phosphotransferase